MSIIARVTSTKQKLATVTEESWHYKLTKKIWGWRLESRTHKACYYWWVRVPSSLFAAGCLAILAALGILIYFLGFIPIGLIAGYTPTFVKRKRSMTEVEKEYDDYHIVYPYRYSPRADHVRRFAPWQFLLPIGGVVVVVLGTRTLAKHHVLGAVGQWTGTIVLAFLVLMSLGFLVKRLGNPTKQGLVDIWSKACPTVNFVHSDEPTPIVVESN